MPNYEYQCRLCAHQWDDIQTIANRDKPCTEPCPQCGKQGAERRWTEAPTACADAQRKPPKAFRERMGRMRDKLGKYNPTVRNNIDRSLDMGGGHYGAR